MSYAGGQGTYRSFQERFDYAHVLFAGLLGFGLFVSIFGTRILNPFFIDWLMHGDYAMHFIGWLFFARESWTFPLGTISNLLYPLGTSIAYTDSLPLLSVLAKLVAPIVDLPFQFYGWWLAISYALQGVFAYMLLSLWLRRHVAIIGSTFFVLSPTLVDRIGHISLSAHWMILAGIWFYADDELKMKSRFLWWIVLDCLAAVTNPYLLVITLAITAASYVQRVLVMREMNRGQAFMQFGSIATAVALALWVFGYIGFVDTASRGFGFFSADLFTFINPLQYSRILPALPQRELQYEGFGYLGAGVLALLLAAVATYVTYRKMQHRFTPLFVATILLFLFALADPITALGNSVLSMPLYDTFSPVRIFRASGRFVWLAHYLIMLFAIVWSTKHIPMKVVTLLLSAGLILQIYDLQPAYVRQHARVEPVAWNLLRSPLWDEVSERYPAIEFVPPFIRFSSCNPDTRNIETLWAIAFFAAQHGLALNSAELTRLPRDINRFCDQSIARIERGEVDADTLYIVDERYLPTLIKSRWITCDSIDLIHVCHN